MTKNRSVKIFFFGDSICFGQGVSPHLTWVSKLSKELHERYQDRLDLLIQNPSVNGNTTRMALERIAYDVQSHAPHIVLVQFGMNDCNGWQTDNGHSRTSKAAFEANLCEIVDRVRVFGARQVIMGTNHPTTRFERLPQVEHTYDQANRSFNGITRRVADLRATLLADAEAACDKLVSAGTATYSDLILADALHLSRRGHEVYFDTRMPVMIEAVERVIADHTRS